MARTTATLFRRPPVASLGVTQKATPPSYLTSHPRQRRFCTERQHLSQLEYLLL